MNLRMIGCTHRAAGVDVREQLAFGEKQASEALGRWRVDFPHAELALISTCNRVELYAAAAAEQEPPSAESLVDALVGYHGLPAERVQGQIMELQGRDAVAHLFRVAASLDSMVVGEPQILAQVKQSYQQAADVGAAGPTLHELFRSAVRAARRVLNETQLHKHRVSIPSVAISDFASGVFERFDDKHILVVGAGEMAEETLRYLVDAGASRIHVINRSAERGRQLAAAWNGVCEDWGALWSQLTAADLVISTTAADEPVVTADEFARHVAPVRQQRPLFVLDLAVPRDFETEVGEQLGVYLYSLDDLSAACERNRRARAKELPAAEKIVETEADGFVAAANRRQAAPVIVGLRKGLEEARDGELERLFGKLPNLDDRQRSEIVQFADRLVNKMLHGPMESLRTASENGTTHGLVEAIKRLFRLED
jgi:glutamyl-tRNA reductase